jgi:pyridoxal phosphate enzyme (YggS family)
LHEVFGGLSFSPRRCNIRENGHHLMAHVNLDKTLARVGEAATRSGRRPEDVVVVAVGKTFPVEVLLEVYEAGHRDFGENRAQELSAKADLLPDDIRWHFVGPLQRNKVRLVRPAVALLHSMDRLALGEAWLKGPGLPPPVLLEVNIGEEPQKAGVAPHQAEEVVGQLIERGVDVRGLMTIPPRVDTPEDARPYFVRMAELREAVRRDYPQISQLSMGMTEDFEIAIEEGATLVRVGRAIFGPRNR